MYLSHAVRLSLVVMLVDAKSGLKSSDIEMLEQLAYYRKRVQIVLSKIDRVALGSIDQSLEQVARRIQIYDNVYPEIYLLSAKDKYGVI